MAFKTFAVAGAGNIGVFLAEELLKQKAAGNAEEVLVLGRLVRALARSILLPICAEKI